MKKVFLLFCILIFALPCFASYKPIPPEKQVQYKTEIEQIINKETPLAKKRIDKEMKYAAKLYKKIVNNKLSTYSIEYTNMTLTEEIVIPFEAAIVYSKLIEATSKYTTGIQTEFHTDDYTPLEDEITPYLKDNKIDITKIIELKRYIYDNCSIIESYADKIRKNNN